jgi:glycosyltransferase involved in cell wall biosynthesis
MQPNNCNVLYIGISGFPMGLAPVERQKLIAKSLVEAGNKVTILCRKGLLDRKEINLPSRGTIDNIHYIYTSWSAYRPKSFVVRNILKIFGMLNELVILLKLLDSKKINIVYFASRKYWYLRLYYFISKLTKFKIVVDYVELASAWRNVGMKFKKFDVYALLHVDGAICISNYLMQYATQIKPDLPRLKVPVLCDLKQIEMIEAKTNGTKYFLYCGSLFYIEVIKFIIDSFEISQNENHKLFIIANGENNVQSEMERYINLQSKKRMIETYSNLHRNELIGLLKGATALLIPMRPITQDVARFPHKIGEYTASGRPIITTNVGEIPNYFTDKVNALIALDYTPKAYALKMEFAVQNPLEALEIGIRGKEIARQEFDYKLAGGKISAFFQQL